MAFLLLSITSMSDNPSPLKSPGCLTEKETMFEAVMPLEFELTYTLSVLRLALAGSLKAKAYEP